MITRRFSQDGVDSEALYSPCENYRYALSRTWNSDLPRLTWVMLNPSTATERQNDPTIARCQKRAGLLGYGAMRIVNIFAWRETSPAALKRASAPIGSENDAAILAAAHWADLVLCGWGAHGEYQNRGAEVAAMLRSGSVALATLGTSLAGHPRHPLYISYQTRPTRWDGHIVENTPN